MRIFVTGGAGYIGSICVEELVKAGHRVFVFDNLSEGHKDAVHPEARFFHGDLQDRSVVSVAIEAAQPDAVMHFAANALVGESMSNPSKYFRNNVYGGINLLDAMVNNDVKKFIFSSTCAIFGIPEEMPVHEDLPKAPINPYGESKLMFERVLHWYRQLHGVEHVALRYFNAAGASETYGEHHRVETHLIPNILMVALGKKEKVDILGTDYPTPDGTCIRDYVHIKDLAQAHMLALEYGGSDVFNLGTGGGTSVKEAVEACRKITGKEIPAEEKPRREGDPPRLIASSEKAKSTLGWKPEHSGIEEIVETAWKWHQAHPDGYAH